MMKKRKITFLFLVISVVVGTIIWFSKNNFSAFQNYNPFIPSTAHNRELQQERMDNAGSTYSDTNNEEKAGAPYEIPAPIKDRKERIIEHIGYTVSYNSDWKIPNWVAYELTKKEVEGTIPRSNHFVPDPEVPDNVTAVDDDYKGSGYDRGHMAPAADMKWSETAMNESFYFSNACPQNHNLNAGIWKSLEEQVRDLAAQKGSIYVVCGPIVSQNYTTIGQNKVVVPKSFYKVLLQKESANWHAIAYIFNNESSSKLMSTYAMSVNEAEKITGLDFFPLLPDDIEEIIENEVDFTQWTIRR